jgi:hypothetical protein
VFAYRCRTGMDQCVDIWSVQTDPSHVTITFASPNGGAPVDDGGNAGN